MQRIKLGAALILVLVAATIFLSLKNSPNVDFKNWSRPSGSIHYGQVETNSTQTSELFQYFPILHDVVDFGWNVAAASKWLHPDAKLYNFNTTFGSEGSTDNVLLVPNVVHYVWLGTDLEFKFIHYVSFLSASRYIRPVCILVYGEAGPRGDWWQRTVAEVDNIFHVHVKTPTHALNGEKFRFTAHASDQLRAEILLRKT